MKNQLKNQVRRVIPLMVALAMIPGLAACGSAGGGQKTTTAASGAASTSATAATVTHKVPKTDWKGATFNILYPDWGLYKDYFFADEQTGDQMNDAIYERTIFVEDYLNVDIKSQNGGTIDAIPSMVQKSVLAGDDAYQLALTHCISGISTLAKGHTLYDWNELPNIDLSADWWNSQMLDELTVNGKSYYAVSDFMIADPNAVLFNKRMVTDYKLEDPYKLVRDGKWTLDKFASIAKSVSQDINGDGVYDNNDLYGFAVQSDWELNSILYACDQFTVKKTATSCTLDMNNEKVLSIIDKVYSLLFSNNSTYMWKFNADKSLQILMDTDRALFNMVALNTAKNYRNTEVDFGILPYPKYDEAQERYLSNDWSGLMCLPATIANPDMVGMVCELLAFKSGSTTIPAYFNILLAGKFARDNESLEMLNIIYDNIVYDFGMNFNGFGSNFFNLFYVIPKMVAQGKSADYSSWYAQYGAGAQGEFDAIIAAYSA